MKTVLVTGGAGYIGSHACKVLAQAGYRPIVYDNLCRGHKWAAQWGPLEVGDIRDRGRLVEVIGRHHCDVVMHFAAHAYVGESVADPGKYYDNNVGGSLALMEAARACHVSKIVFSSSCATYGVPERIPIDETHPQRPINPYGASKQMVERMLRDFSSAYGMRYVVLRYFNAAGADCDGDIGESHRPETHLIPLALKAALGQGECLHVYGDDYETPDGTCIRDYIHVTDIAHAHAQALRHLERGENSAIYNLGTGRGYSIREIIASVERVTGKDVPLIWAPRRAGDPAELVSDATKAKTLLNWVPRFACIDILIETAMKWLLQGTVPAKTARRIA